MAIITISRGSYSKGKEVAERVAERLGYQCISREVILEASDVYRIPEIKLVKAIHDAPSILDRFGRGKHAFIAYYQSALARMVRNDKVVYHGLAGHLLLKGVPHVLKVRIIADLADRVESEMHREGLSEQEARSLILKDDQERRRWTQSLYGMDPWDSSLYDLVIHIHKFTVANAVDFICEAAGLEQFKATRESQQKMDDLAMASHVKAGPGGAASGRARGMRIRQLPHLHQSRRPAGAKASGKGQDHGPGNQGDQQHRSSSRGAEAPARCLMVPNRPGCS